MYVQYYATDDMPHEWLVRHTLAWYLLCCTHTHTHIYNKNRYEVCKLLPMSLCSNKINFPTIYRSLYIREFSSKQFSTSISRKMNENFNNVICTYKNNNDVKETEKALKAKASPKRNCLYSFSFFSFFIAVVLLLLQTRKFIQIMTLPFINHMKICLFS